MKKGHQIEHWTLPAPPEKYESNHYVNLLSDPNDYHVVLLASMGFTFNVIASQTGMSFGQISYRLRRANRNRKPHERINSINYRNGSSDAARAVIQLASKKVAQIINPELRKSLAVDI